MKTEYQSVEARIEVDIDNERPYDSNIVGLTKTDHVRDFKKNIITLREGDYIYVYTESIEDIGLSYIFAEGRVIKNPYADLPYKWCCVIQGEVEFSEDYKERFNVS